MSLVIEEMKKILTGKKMLLLFGFAVLYYFMFLHPFVNIYKGSYHQEADIAAGIIKQYGTVLSEDEWEDLNVHRPRGGESEIDQMIQRNERFTEFGITTFLQFINEMGELSEAESVELWMELYDQFDDKVIQEEITNIIELNVYDFYLESYQTECSAGEDKSEWYKETNNAQKERIRQRNQAEVMGLIPACVLQDNLEVLQFWSAFVLLSTIILIVPYMVKENRNKMPAIQYSMRAGRKFFCYRCVAVICSAGVVLAAEIGWYALMAGINRVFDFWNCPVAACTSMFIGWFPWTLGTLTLTAIGVCLLAALGMALLVMGVTTRMSNYMTAIAWQIPFAVMSGLFGGYFMITFGEITSYKWLASAAAMGIFLLGTLIILFYGLGERQRNC